MAWSILITTLKWSIGLAFTFLVVPPFLNSFATSILFITWSQETMRAAHDHLLTIENTRWEYDIASKQHGPSRDHASAQYSVNVLPFRVPKLWTYDWAEQMGIEKPLQHKWTDLWRYHREGERMDRLGSADGLMWDSRKALGGDGKMPQIWVYVTENFYDGEGGPQIIGSSWMSGTMSFREAEAEGAWDRAFVKVVEGFRAEGDQDAKHDLNGTKNESTLRKFFFVDSKESRFLVRAWGVKAPCLLHFVVDEATDDSGTSPAVGGHEDKKGLWEAILDIVEGTIDEKHSYDIPAAYLKPVAVRAIDLPTDDTTQECSTSGKHQNEFEQLQTLMSGEEIWKSWPRFNTRKELFQRFAEYWQELPGLKGRSFCCLRKLDGWSRTHVGQPLNIIRFQEELEGIGSVSGFLIAPLIMFLSHWTRRSLERYLGIPKPVQRPLTAG